MEPIRLPCVEPGVQESELGRLLARQDGVISAGQAMGLGMTRASIGRRVARGLWRSVGTGVYLSGERQLTDSAKLRAAVLGAGRGACAFGPSAAWWHGVIDRAPRELWLNVPGSRYIKRENGVRTRRRDLQWRDVEKVRGLHVTVLPLAVLEACVLVPNGSQVMDRALQRHTTLPILQRVHDMHAGRRGSHAAGKLLRIAEEGGHSEAERMLLRLLRGAGITGWRTHVGVGRFEVDVAFVRERVVIEVDGWAWHRDVERFDHDAERHNILSNAGWQVLHFTYHRVAGDPAGVIADVRSALAQDRSR